MPTTHYMPFFNERKKEKTTLPVPVREGYIFGGWYLDWTLSDQITDETGKIVSKRNPIQVQVRLRP